MHVHLLYKINQLLIKLSEKRVNTLKQCSLFRLGMYVCVFACVKVTQEVCVFAYSAQQDNDCITA